MKSNIGLKWVKNETVVKNIPRNILKFANAFKAAAMKTHLKYKMKGKNKVNENLKEFCFKAYIFLEFIYHQRQKLYRKTMLTHLINKVNIFLANACWTQV